MKDKFILDVTCGTKGIWYNKSHSAAVYCDRRIEEKGFIPQRQNAEVKPDVICDFRELPFPDKSFKLVVFDPPHMKQGKAGHGDMLKRYGCLDNKTWAADIKKGFDECWRVLEDYGVLIFKWCEISIKNKDVLEVLGREPLFGHVTSRTKNTLWATFMKFP